MAKLRDKMPAARKLLAGDALAYERAEVEKLRDALERLTEGMTDHPQWYDGPCRCHECMSYGASDGEP